MALCCGGESGWTQASQGLVRHLGRRSSCFATGVHVDPHLRTRPALAADDGRSGSKSCAMLLVSFAHTGCLTSASRPEFAPLRRDGGTRPAHIRINTDPPPNDSISLLHMPAVLRGLSVHKQTAHDASLSNLASRGRGMQKEEAAGLAGCAYRAALQRAFSGEDPNQIKRRIARSYHVWPHTSPAIRSVSPVCIVLGTHAPSIRARRDGGWRAR
jgi:hypothetical protein